MASKKSTKQLLDFIISKELELVDYPSLKPEIDRYFLIRKYGEGIQAFTKELIESIIDWEKGNKTSSLEKLIDDNYIVWLIDKNEIPKKQTSFNN